jgi:hypothetical protein
MDPADFPLLIGSSRGRAMAMIAFFDPRVDCRSASGEGHAPVAAVLVPAVKRQARISDIKRAPIPLWRDAE